MARQLIRSGRKGDDRGSLALAMLLITVAMALASLLVPVVLTQVHASTYDSRRDHALNAAQAGIDVMVGDIRSAQDGAGAGQLNKLPCTTAATGGPTTGTVDPAGTLTYSASVYYFATDPRGHVDGDDNWLDDPSKQIKCTANGTGTAPSYAEVVSTGADTSGVDGANAPTRTMEATYVFKRTNANVLGGQIHSYTSKPALCLDAGSTAPALGSVPTLQLCQSNYGPQLWSFNPNNTVSLAATTDTATNNLGLCLDVPYSHYKGEPVQMQKCSTATKPEQQFGFQGLFPTDFVATNADGTQPDMGVMTAGNCWQPSQLQFVGAQLILGACEDSNNTPGFDPRTLMVYDPTVGAGNASDLVPNSTSNPTWYSTRLGYLNNYSEFGRCLDTTLGYAPSAPSTKYMIAYFCRTTPDPAVYPKDAQLWTTPQVAVGATVSPAGTIHLTYDFAPGNAPHPNDRRKACLTTPTDGTPYPYLASTCNGSAAQNWRMYGDTGNYATSYRIMDTYGRCMQPDPADLVPEATLAGDVSKIIVTTCSSSTLQKWNAPPGVIPQPIKDYHEKSGS